MAPVARVLYRDEKIGTLTGAPGRSWAYVAVCEFCLKTFIDHSWSDGRKRLIDHFNTKHREDEE
jgi:hypothetical protein